MNVKLVKTEDISLNAESERIIRELYAAAEVQDVEKFISLFTEDGTFNDESAGKIYTGKKRIGPSCRNLCYRLS